MGNYKSYGGIYIMKDIRKYKYSIAAMFSLLLLVLSGGCSKDEGGTPVPEKQFRTIEITINSKSNANPYTRAVDDEIVSEGSDEEYERHIDQYWLVIEKKVGDSYQVDRIVTDGVDGYVQPGTGDDSETSLTVEVEVGETYRFSALANLSGLVDGDKVISDLNGTVGESFDEFLSTAVSVKEMPKYYKGGSYIPMTSYTYEQTIYENTAELSEAIQLIRMIGKVTLEVRNLTENPISLKSLKMGEFRTSGEIYLFPYDLATNKGTQVLIAEDEYMQNTQEPNVPDGGTYNDINFTVPTDPIQPLTSIETKGTELTVYVPETDAQGAADLMITTEIPGRNNNPVSSRFSFVRRNDWLKLPIQITDVDVEITFDQQHMPIGGLPQKVTFEEDIQIPIATFTTNHSGNINMTFKLNGVGNNLFSTPEFKFDNSEDPVNVVTKAILKTNTNDFLLNPPAENLFTVTPALGNKSGTFSLNVQELANYAKVEIELTLIIVDGSETNPSADRKLLTVPYTIIIQNKRQSSN